VPAKIEAPRPRIFGALLFSNQHRHRTFPQLQPILLPIEPAIDAPGDLLELALVGQGVQSVCCPKPSRRQASILWLVQQLGLIHQVNAQRFTARRVVRPTGDLNQATPAILEAVTGYRIAQVCPALLTTLSRRRPPNLTDVDQLAGLMANLGDEGATRLLPTIWYRCMAVLRTGTKTPALGPAFGRICSSCCDVMDMGFSR